MKFVKGMMIGLGIGAGAAIMTSEGMMNKKIIMKKGKQMMRKMGI